MQSLASLLVIKIRALGDTLLATPALRSLRRGLPAARITALVGPAGKEILEDNPDVDEVLVYDKSAAEPVYTLGLIARLRSKRFDAAIALHASFRTSLLAWGSGARVRVVHNHSGRNFFSTQPILAKKQSKSAIERDLDAIRALGLSDAGPELSLTISQRHHQAAEAFLREQKLTGSRRLYLLAPGAGKARKRWTPEAAADFLRRIPRRMKGDWILLAGPQEAGLVNAVRSQISQELSALPVFSGSIKEAAALMARCQGMVTADSGPKHVAVAMGIPTLTLWTDEPEAEWHPYDFQQHDLVRSRSGLVADISAAEVVERAVRHFERK